MKLYLAITSRGLENLLSDELQELGASNIHVVNAGVRFEADEKTLYTCCLWSRVASRFILVLSEFSVHDDMDLYLGASAIDWPSYFSEKKRIVVDFNGTNNEIRNSQYGALKVKDAIVDRFTKANLERPSIDKEQPDLRIHMRLLKEKGLLGIDMVGSGLHQRGYRTEAGLAPLRETNAAALIAKSGWNKEIALLDPMCGSGTLLIEAAMIAAKIAPGLKRKRWGFQSLRSFNTEQWLEVHSEVTFKSKKGPSQCETRFFGYDIDRSILQIAVANAQRAGVGSLIQFELGDAAKLEKPDGFDNGHIICNPPYGERLGTTPGLIALYTQFGAQLKTHFKGAVASIYSGSDELLSCLRMRADKNYKLRNGTIECVMKTYPITARGEVTPSQDAVQAPLPDVAPEFANRLQKNIKKVEKWAKKEGIECYRLYDADLPDYNVAIDRYKEFVVIQEYAPPKSVPEEKARRRLLDLVRATIPVVGVSANHVILKTREKQKGTRQYQKLNETKRFLKIKEYGATLEVNLEDYLDTGLFLDHRLTRKMLGEMAKGKDFLNLFAYTGTATVHAAMGGAKSTTTIDMSKTYLEWAERNMKLNSKIGLEHKYIHSDCLKWLAHSNDQFDLIFIDPPTFSNSKRMTESFDVQRDHVKLFTDLKRLLRHSGTLVFSNNKRNFKMDFDALSDLGLSAQNITARSMPLDFERNKHIHNCWIVSHKEVE